MSSRVNSCALLSVLILNESTVASENGLVHQWTNVPSRPTLPRNQPLRLQSGMASPVVRCVRRLSSKIPSSPTVNSNSSHSLAVALNKRMGDGLPARLGFRVESADASAGHVRASMELTPAHLAPNGFCHAASIIALADSACGAGTFITLPPGVHNFTTTTISSSHIGTAIQGRILCEAQQAHAGKSTQVWDAVVYSAEGKKIALFRCTQLLLGGRKKCTAPVES